MKRTSRLDQEQSKNKPGGKRKTHHCRDGRPLQDGVYVLQEENIGLCRAVRITGREDVRLAHAARMTHRKFVSLIHAVSSTGGKDGCTIHDV